MNNNNIITPEIKVNDTFQKHLGSLARSDAHHDLHDAFSSKDYEPMKKTFNSGLPLDANFNDYHETGSLRSVILKIGEKETATMNDEKFKIALNELQNVDEINVEPTIFEIGYNHENNKTPVFNYKVVRYNSLENDGGNFFKKTNLGAEVGEAAIIVDFSQHHFIENFANGANNKDSYTVHYLMTSEMVNDPAGKPNIHNESLFNQTEKGINLISYIQTDVEPLLYTKFDPANSNTANNFFSKYDFNLSPIQQQFLKGKAERLITTLTINFEEPGQKQLTQIINDSKSENSNATVIGYLKKIVNSLKNQSDRTTAFNFNSKCQQKRGGDWFQALCCLDARNRSYTQILPNNNRTNGKINEKCPIYFVTHDQIAAAFALLNGVNVIFISGNKSIYVFKNNADSTVKGNGKPIEEILFEGMKKKFVNEQDIVSLINFAKKYQDSRIKVLQEEIATFDKVITDNSILLDVNNKLFEKNFTEKIQNVFSSAVRFMFITMNVIDIQKNINNVSTYYKLLFQENVSITENSENIIQLNKSFNIINSILDKYGKAAPQDMLLETSIKNWINLNIKKLDVYKAANTMDLYVQTESEIFDINRIVNFENNSENKRVTDKHIFLPFIQTLDKQFKKDIIDVLNILTEQLKDFLKEQPEYKEQNKNNDISFKNIFSSLKKSIINVGRGSRISGKIKFYNNSANLIFESMLLLITDNEEMNENIMENINEENLLLSHSTDEIIINEDFQELERIQDGKSSNSTEMFDEMNELKRYNDLYDPFDEEEILKDTLEERNKRQRIEMLGGNILNDYSNPTSNKKIGNVICDVGIQQMTYPLLTNLLLKPMVKETFHKIFDKEIFNSIDKTNLINQFNLIRNLNQNKIANDFQSGHHPLVPIYMILSPFFYTLESKYDSYPYFDTYFIYFDILEKMVNVFETNYLNDFTNKEQIIKAYLIGFGLGHMLFTSNIHLPLNDSILKTIQPSLIGGDAEANSQPSSMFYFSSLFNSSDKSTLDSKTSKTVSTIETLPSKTNSLNITTTNKQDNFVESQKKYYNFSLKNSSISTLITGSIHLNDKEINIGLALLENNIFKQFINREINIGDRLKINRYTGQSLSYVNLKEKVFNLLKRINTKIIQDKKIIQENIPVNIPEKTPNNTPVTQTAGTRKHKNKKRTLKSINFKNLKKQLKGGKTTKKKKIQKKTRKTKLRKP